MNPISEEWSKFGGYKHGPKYEATGHFRVEKINSKWWFIDPEGYLFWSSGVNSAGKFNIPTPLMVEDIFLKTYQKRQKQFL